MAFVVSALVSRIGIHWLSPDFESYVSLSGVLHHMVIWDAIRVTLALESGHFS
jgi:hypothetical protein